MESEAISCCIGPLSRDYLSKIPHHVAPCTNLHTVLPYKTQEDDVSVLLAKPFPYTSSVPVPLTPLAAVERSTLNGLDPTITLIREKIKWQTKKEKILKAVNKDAKNIKPKLLDQAVNVPINGTAALPQGVVLLAQHLDKDPDKGFSGSYNWYYTGGTLSTLNYDDEEDLYLLHASHSTLNCSKWFKSGEPLLLSSVNVADENNDRIYQVLSNLKGAAVRQKSKVTLLTPVETEDQSIQLETIISVTDSKPFLSTALRKRSLRKFCTLSNGGALKLWDVEYARSSESGNPYKDKIPVTPPDRNTVTDSWGSVQYVNDKTILLADRCCLRLIDIRAGVNEVQQHFCPRSMLETCEQLSYVTHSSVCDQVTYTLTTHQALTLDLRMGFLQRWTHMMTSPPYMGFAQVMPDNQEVLCLGSQASADCVAIVNSVHGDYTESQHSPRSLPSMVHGLHLARQRAMCLDPTLTQRCSQSQTGMTYLPAGDNGIYVVRQTASGDVFVQQLTLADDTQLTEVESSAYQEWSSPTLALQRETTAALNVTCVADLTQLVKVLSNPEMPMDRKKPESGLSALQHTDSKWKVSKSHLEDCVDLLAGKMLAVWDVEEEEEWAPEAKDESLEEQDPEEKVLNWLDQANPSNTTANITGIKPTITSTPFPPSQILFESQPSQPTQTSSIANITAMHSQTPAIACTPFLTGQPSTARLTQENEAWPWMTQPSQVTPRKLNDVYLDSPHHSTPPSSGGSARQARKRQKLSYNTSPTRPASAKKPVRSVKKSVPGF